MPASCDVAKPRASCKLVALFEAPLSPTQPTTRKHVGEATSTTIRKLLKPPILSRAAVCPQTIQQQQSPGWWSKLPLHVPPLAPPPLILIYSY